VLESAEEGLLLLSCGMRGNVVRFLPALTIQDDLLQEGLDCLEKVLRALN
jgi:4-aminobutyrate aminotransferase-like enzyme